MEASWNHTKHQNIYLCEINAWAQILFYKRLMPATRIEVFGKPILTSICGRQPILLSADTESGQLNYSRNFCQSVCGDQGLSVAVSSLFPSVFKVNSVTTGRVSELIMPTDSVRPCYDRPVRLWRYALLRPTPTLQSVRPSLVCRSKAERLFISRAFRSGLR